MADPDILFTTPDTGAPADALTPSPDAASGVQFTTPATGTPTGRKLLERKGSNDPEGFEKNTKTGILRMASHVPGFLGDARELGDLAASNVMSILPGETRSAKEIRDEAIKRRAFEFDRMMSIHGPTAGATPVVGRALHAANSLPSGSEWYSEHIEPALGSYDPETRAGRIYQAGLESAMPLPGGVASTAARAPTILGRAGQVAGRVASSGPVTGALMGATAQGVGEIAGPGTGIAASLAVPALTRHAAPGASAEERAADRLWRTTGRDTDDALTRLRELGKVGYRGEAGSPLTLAEATGNAPLGYAEKTHAVADTTFGADVNRLRGEQAQNRERHIGTMANGDPMKVSDVARQMRDDLYAQADQATQSQQAILDAMQQPGATSKESSGKRAFDIAEHNNERARATVSQLYRAIDPENRIHLDLTPLNERATEVLQSIDPRKHLPSPEAEKVVQMARDLPPSMAFSDLVEFDKTVGQALWRAGKAGDAHGADMLKRLQSRIDEIRDGSLDRYATWEQGAVNRGELRPDQTINARLQRQFAQSGDAGRGRASATAGTGAVSTGPAAPAAGHVEGRPGAAPAHPGGGEGVPGDAFDPAELAAAAGRQNLAKQGHSLRKTVFEEGPVGTHLTNDRPLMGNVPGSAFAAGPVGAEKTRAWMTAGAGRPEMLEAVKDMAVNELHGLMKDGVVTQQALDQWKRRFGPALSEIDRRDPGFSSRFDAHAAQQQRVVDTAAASQRAKDTIARTQLAKFLRYEHPDEVNAHIGRMMQSGQGAVQLRQLMGQLRGNVEAQEGVRAAAVDWLKDQARSRERAPGPGGSSVNVSAPGNYLEAMENARPHLEAVFGPEGYAAATHVASEMARTKAAMDARLTRGGSDTAKNLAQFLNEFGAHDSHALSTAEGFAIWKTIEELSHGVIHMDPSAFARAGMMIAGRYGLHRWQEAMTMKRGRAAREEGDLIRQALLDPAYGHALLEKGRERAAAAVPTDLRDRLRQAQVAGAEADRQPRARGGVVHADAVKHAARMVRLVSEVRRNLSQETAPLLDAHDDAVAGALETARRAAGGTL